MIFPNLTCQKGFVQDSSPVRRMSGIKSFFVPHWLPLALITSVYFLSLFLRENFGELTFAPLLSLLSLLILAMFRGPGFVLLWIFPFTVVSYELIQSYSQYVWMRSASLILGGLIAAYAAFLRAKAVSLSTSLENIFARISYPVIVSDSTSRIVFFNDAACNSLKITAAELRGFSWFNLLLDEGCKTADIEKYVRLGVSPNAAEEENFRLVGFDGKRWDALVMKEGPSQKSRLITTLKAPPA